MLRGSRLGFFDGHEASSAAFFPGVTDSGLLKWVYYAGAFSKELLQCGISDSRLLAFQRLDFAARRFQLLFAWDFNSHQGFGL